MTPSTKRLGHDPFKIEIVGSNPRGVIKENIMRWTWEEAKASWERGDNQYLKDQYPTLKDFYRYWLKCCKSK